MSQPQHDYPASIREAGPDAMHAYDALLSGLRAANGAAGPARVLPEEIALILARLGKGPMPDMPHVVKHDEPTVLDDEE